MSHWLLRSIPLSSCPKCGPIAHERPGQTLQATALVHEAYLRLVGDEPRTEWEHRGHFFAAAAEAMRRILVENARRKRRMRHGGDVGGGKISFRAVGEHCLTVQPGTYHVRLIDSDVYWIDPQSRSPIPSRTEVLALNDGSASTFVAERRWQDFVHPEFGLQQDTPSDPKTSYELVWFGRGNPRGYGLPGFALNRAQAACVSRLFQGLADGKPDVAEEELLIGAEATTMSELFPSGEGATIEQTWGRLFVRGDQPNTWRLNVPEPASRRPPRS